MGGDVAAPGERWQDLLAAGLGHLREVRRYGWFTAAQVAATVIAGLIPDESELGLLALPLALLAVYIVLPLARQMLTGTLTLAPWDARALLRSAGLAALFLLAAGPLLLLGLAGGWAGFVAAACLAVLLALVVAARLSFYLPALALDHPTSLTTAFAQGRARWRDLAILPLLTYGPSLAASALLPHAGLPSLLANTVDGLLGAAAVIVCTGAVCDLYRRTIAPASISGEG